MRKPHVFSLLIISCLLSVGTLRAEEETFTPDYITDDILPQLIEDVQTVHSSMSKPLDLANQTKCDQAYSKLFNKDQITMSVYFGYADLGKGDKNTGDIAERAWFEDQLTEPCVGNLVVCNLTPSETDDDVYYKKIKVNGRTVKIAMKLYNASLTDNVKINTESRATEQLAKSQAIQDSYMQSLQRDDIVIYFGHARYGSGPGFKPIKDFSNDWYKNYLRIPFLKEIRQTLKQTESPAKLIGMINCDAQAHYGHYLSKSAPTSALLMARQTISSSDALRTLFMSVQGLLSLTCEPEMNELFKKTLTRIYYWHYEPKPTSVDDKTAFLFNFYDNEKVEGNFYWQWMFNDLASVEKSVEVVDLTKANNKKK